MATTSRGKLQKPSKVVKPKKSKRKSTPSTRQHRFQPFSERIAKLKIDPIRRRRGQDAQIELQDSTSSYFATALEEWREINLSHTFSSFATEATPLCDSLPMVLHNEEKIAEALVGYIEKGDGLALEALLNLMAHFAHDLDTSFEKHFPRAVAAILLLAAKHQDPAVIEWSFTCLAWLFKHLSRLLVPDLRPLYDLVAPYLGKQDQKPFIIRFAAESISFLVRKAGATYERDPLPLDLITKHMLDDCSNSTAGRSYALYSQGIMTLLTESMKGVQRGLHSSGLAMFRSLLKQWLSLSGDAQASISPIMAGSLTSIIHHTDAENFKPLLDEMLDLVEQSDLATQQQRVIAANSMLITVISVRKGSRVSDWSRLTQIVVETIAAATSGEVSTEAANQANLLYTLAVTFQTAPMDALVSRLDVLDTVRKGIWTAQFLSFCDIFARLGHVRFQSLLLPSFQKFILEHWQHDMQRLCLLVAKLGRALPNTVMLQCPSEMQSTITEHFGKLRNASNEEFEEETGLSECNTELAALTYLKFSEASKRKLFQHLRSLLKHAGTTSRSTKGGLSSFAFGRVLCYLVEGDGELALDREIWELLCSHSQHWANLVPFWSGTKRYLASLQALSSDFAHKDKLESALVCGLASPSHEIRQTCLEIFQLLYKKQKQEVPEMLTIAALIESTPVALDTARSIALNIRRLAAAYSGVSHPLMQRAIPTYCFGLLHLKLSQAWEDAVNAISQICKTGYGEEVVTSLVPQWLEGSSEEAVGLGEEFSELDVRSDGFRVESDFECPNLAKMIAIRDQVFIAPHHISEVMQRSFRIDHQTVPALTPNSRNQALRVLHKIPHIAEKRSRLLVPLLLRWAGEAGTDDDDDISSREQRWSRKDQKAMLGVFAQFINPKVLYRSQEVYQSYLGLLTNGDVEIQRAALKAVVSWKNPAINRYEEHLVNVLDDSRFREEISVFLQAEHAGEALREEDRKDLMPVLLRLLYGKAVAGARNGQQARRKAIFVALSRFGQQALGMFVDIACGKPGAVELHDQVELHSAIAAFTTPLRKQLGMLNMLDDMLGTVGPDLKSSAVHISAVVLLCLVKASRQLNSISERSENEIQDESLLRSVRQTGFRCLVKLFSGAEDVEWAPTASIVVRELIEPRLMSFASENAQSVSGTLRLLSAWASSPKTASFLIDFNAKLLERVAACLGGASAKEDVRLFIVEDVLGKLLETAEATSLISSIVHQAVGPFIPPLQTILRHEPSKELLDAGVRVVSQLVGYVSNASEARDLMEVCTLLLKKPTKTVSYHTKLGLLSAAASLLRQHNIERNAGGKDLYETICTLFARFRGAESRVLLCETLTLLSEDNDALNIVAAVCEGLNAVATAHLDSPDFNRRYEAFTLVNEGSRDWTLAQWQPVLYNCLYFVRDEDDIATRTSASLAVRRFIDSAARQPDCFRSLISSAIIPGIEHGMQESSELVRSEYLSVLAHLVKHPTVWPGTGDLTCLLADGDEEASFFNNILHIQQHRRLRALQRLASDSVKLSNSNISKMLLPLLEHFIFDQAEGDSAQNLANEAIKTLGALTSAMTWSSFRAVMRRYISYIKSKPDMEKMVLRLVGSLVDGLYRSHLKRDLAIPDLPDVSSPMQAAASADFSRLAATLPTAEKLSIDIDKELLPPLTEYLHLKDESTVDRRVPVAIAIVKLLRLFPPSEFAARLPPVLTDVCQVLRSRSQEARDQTRRTLAQITALVGPRYFGFVLKELRSALHKGYQLHVLSFTVHSLIVHEANSFQPGELDYCVPDMTAVIMDDIFGITGQEKDAEEYKSGMKEVKSSKSYDTMEHLAKVTSVNKLGQLIQPIRILLLERLDLKRVQKIDALLIRIRNGIRENAAVNARETLVFCHEIIRLVHALANESRSLGQDTSTKKYLIAAKRLEKSTSNRATFTYSFKLVSFSLNLLQSVLRKHEDLQTPANIAGFLPIIGDAMVGEQEEVKLAAMRLLATVVKTPLVELETSAPLYVMEAVAMIRSQPSTNTESAQAALKLVTAVLREKRDVDPRDTDIAFLLKALVPDLDEPEQRTAVFAFLKAVIGRKIVIAEVYEVMDKIRTNMITNPDRDVRDSSRSAYMQFVMSYPQGKHRWSKQAGFLVTNLEYEHKSGRTAVLEALATLLSKIGDDVLQQLAPMFFAPLVMVLVNDEESVCREMAAALIRMIFERANDEVLAQILASMRTWLQDESNDDLRTVALQCWGIYLGVGGPSGKELSYIRKQLTAVLNMSLGDSDAEHWQPLYQALAIFSTMCEIAPAAAFEAKSAKTWSLVQQCLRYPHAWVKLSTLKILGLYFADVARTSAKAGDGLSALPLHGSGGLELTGDDMLRMCNASLAILRVPGISQTLAAQTTVTLVFLGRCFDANRIRWSNTETSATRANDLMATCAEEQETEDDEEEGEQSLAEKTAVNYLIRRLSATVRRDTNTLVPRLAALQCLEALLRTLPIDSFTLPELVLAPIFTLTDRSIPQPASIQPLVEKAQEVQELMEKKLGTSDYIKVMSKVQAAARGKRDERRQKRRIDAVAAPEKWARDKKRKYEGKKIKRKEKGIEARGKRRGW